MSRIRPIAVALSLLAAVTVANAQTPKTPAPAKAPAAKTEAADQKAKLPAAVEAAFKKAYPNATIKNASSEKEDGKVEWEVESVDGKVNRDLVYLADGTLVAAEEQIDAAAVPASVITAFKARYPKAAVTKYEKLTKGTAISYEMAITGAGAVKEVELAPDGTFINPKPVKK